MRKPAQIELHLRVTHGTHAGLYARLETLLAKWEPMGEARVLYCVVEENPDLSRRSLQAERFVADVVVEVT